MTYPVGEGIMRNIAGPYSAYLTEKDIIRFLTDFSDIPTITEKKLEKRSTEKNLHNNGKGAESVNTVNTDFLHPPLKPKKKSKKLLNRTLPPLSTGFDDSQYGIDGEIQNQDDYENEKKMNEIYYGISEKESEKKKNKKRKNNNSDKILFDDDQESTGPRSTLLSSVFSTSLPNLLNTHEKGSMEKLLYSRKKGPNFFTDIDVDKYCLILPKNKEGVLDLPSTTLISKRIILKEMKKTYAKWKKKVDIDLNKKSSEKMHTDNDHNTMRNLVQGFSTHENDMSHEKKEEKEAESSGTMKSTELMNTNGSVDGDHDIALIRQKWFAQSTYYQYSDQYEDGDGEGDGDDNNNDNINLHNGSSSGNNSRSNSRSGSPYRDSDQLTSTYGTSDRTDRYYKSRSPTGTSHGPRPRPGIRPGNKNRNGNRNRPGPLLGGSQSLSQSQSQSQSLSQSQSQYSSGFEGDIDGDNVRENEVESDEYLDIGDGVIATYRYSISSRIE